MDIYNSNRLVGIDNAIEASSVARAIINEMENRTLWTVSASELLDKMNDNTQYTRAADWPRSPEALMGAIKRIVSPLASLGIKIEWGEREATRERKRIIRISKDIRPVHELS